MRRIARAVVESEARAREITDYRIRKRRVSTSTRTLEGMMQQLKDAGRKHARGADADFC